ncbi:MULTISPECIES: SixA phosphatase family protein [Mameliella]|uniref:SixA phosphatase family protein n=1 Tax=Mameliella TaxID=1434019 RepID=UPI000B52B876|nr:MULTISPECIES: histidine phosphatase family protein [Mameliella]MCR9271517.1 histidine phosphatase family protein [Paracoccaceae bacterium]OWV61028.1 phosphoglycerate mutase [Mameliella alba]
MKQLILIRHAKSDWSHGLPDHDRPLNSRGRRAAPAIGDWLREKGFLPDDILCSTATRTRETLALLGAKAPVRFEPALYHAAPETMLEILKTAAGNSVMMLGHNPGIAALAEDLLESPPDHPRFAAYPTCATLVARFDIDDWRRLQPGTGTAEAFIVPRDLTD